MDKSKILKLKNLIKELEEYHGRHTELVSVYAPSGYNINVLAKQIDSEKSTASNIKSKTTRSNVISALEAITRFLKGVKKTPENGLVIFAGNISKKEGKSDIKLWHVIPPKVLNVKYYRCDQIFYLDPLKEMVATDEIYGLLVIDRKEATFGLLEGTSIKILKGLSSGVPGKIRAGGQSSQRFHRIIEGKAKEFYRRVAETAKTFFFDMEKLRGIIVGGPGPTKDDFLAEGNLATALKKKVIAVKDIGYADEAGLNLLVGASQDILSKTAIINEKKILERFFKKLAKQPDLVSYGLADVEKAIKLGAADHVLISVDEFPPKKIEEIEEKAQNINAKVSYISSDTEEGVQFKNLGGIGAFLRFAVGE